MRDDRVPVMGCALPFGHRQALEPDAGTKDPYAEGLRKIAAEGTVGSVDRRTIGFQSRTCERPRPP